ncbi:hypothetical protein B0H13DRAFT_2057054 [Mycena leptocephala]|nr:hypothetical protein B0H13DRAFT_2057054 [Mycena leptocephala]
MEEATQNGFPSIEPITTIKGVSWDATVYAGLRQFHQAKGFDPDSLDLARELGCPLYQILDVDGDDAQEDPVRMHESEVSPGSTRGNHETLKEDRQEEPELSRSQAEMLAVSDTFKFLMNVQLALILFLALSWLYNLVWSG